MPTGLRNTPGPFGAGVLGAGAGPNTGPKPGRGAVNKQYIMVFASQSPAVGPWHAPNIPVNPGENCFIRANNGLAANTHVIRIALNREELVGLGGYTITPDTEIAYPVDNVGQLWVLGLDGDGAIFSVRANST
jgi:hypothetical protein